MSATPHVPLLLRLIEKQRIREEELAPVVAQGNFDWVSDYTRSKYSLAVSAPVADEATPSFAVLEHGEILAEATLTHEELLQLRNYLDLLLVN